MTWPTKTDFVDGDVLTAAQVNNIGTNLNEADPTGITDGYVLTADGADGMGWEAIVSGGLTQIATGTLSGSTLNITSIPQTYKDLYLQLYNVQASTNLTRYRLNNNSTSNVYQQTWVKPGVTPDQQYGGLCDLIFVTPATPGYLSATLIIPYYTANAYRTLFSFARHQEAGTPGHESSMTTTSVNTTMAVNEINLFTSSGTWAGGTYKLFGAS